MQFHINFFVFIDELIKMFNPKKQIILNFKLPTSPTYLST
jgi:hypothetical protein